MKKFGLFFLLINFLVISSFCIDLDEILNKHYQAMGGKEKLLATKNLIMKGKIIIAQAGMELPIEWYFKYPDKIKWISSFSGQVMVQAINGDSGWTINPFIDPKTPQPLSSRELKDLKKMLKMQDVLVRFKETGIKLRFLREDIWEGTPVYIIEAYIDDSLRCEIYLDQESFLEIREVSFIKEENRELTASTIFSDYKKVNDVLVPHSISIQSENGKIELIFSEIKIAENIDDSEFIAPKIEKEEK